MSNPKDNLRSFRLRFYTWLINKEDDHFFNGKY